MAGATITGAEGGQSFLGTLETLASAGIGIYGQVLNNKAESKQQDKILSAATSISANQAAAASAQTKVIAAGVGVAALLLALFLITKRKHK